MKATQYDGTLAPINNCYLKIINADGDKTIYFNNLPDISDTKSVNYPDENGIGRSTPFKSFRNSETRSISITAHFFTFKEGDAKANFEYLRWIQAATYPYESKSTGYTPPPICKLKCGPLLSKDELCAVLKSYSFKADPQVPWHPVYYLPYKFDVDMTFDVVYDNSQVPFSNKIIKDL